MSRRKLGRFCLGVSMLIAALGAVGCAGVLSSTPEQIVAARAKARWDHLIAGVNEWPKAYDLIEPSYRNTRSYKDYVDGFVGKVAWRKVEVLNVKCEPETCQVRLAVTAKLPFAGSEVTTGLDETWLLSDGNWYYHKPD